MVFLFQDFQIKNRGLLHFQLPNCIFHSDNLLIHYKNNEILYISYIIKLI